MSEVSEQQLESLKPENPDEISGSLSRDFKLSFKYAQGERPYQAAIAVYIARYYKNKYGDQSEDSINSLRSQLESEINNFRVPNNHTQVTDKDAAAEFQRALDLQIEAFYNVFLGKSTYDVGNAFDEKKVVFQWKGKSNGELLASIASHTIDRDLYYQEKPREGRGEGQDLHESFLKTYVVDKKPCNSQTFDNMFGEVANLISRSDGKIRFGAADLLLTKWRTRHPGQNFYSRKLAA